MKPETELEREVLDAVRRGDRRHGLHLVCAAFKDPIYRFCVRFTGSESVADDLAQETFVAAYDALPEYRGDGQLKAWLYGIAKNKCALWLRQRLSRANLERLHGEAIEHHTMAPPPSPTDHPSHASQLIDWATAELAADDRSLLWMHVEGLTAAELVAAHPELSLSEEAVRVRIHRVRRRLRERIESAG